MPDKIDIILEKIADVDEKVDRIHDKLFVGNSQPPLTVQIDRLNGFMSKSKWFYGIIAVAIVTLIGKIIYALVIS